MSDDDPDDDGPPDVFHDGDDNNSEIEPSSQFNLSNKLTKENGVNKERKNDDEDIEGEGTPLKNKTPIIPGEDDENEKKNNKGSFASSKTMISLSVVGILATIGIAVYFSNETTDEDLDN